MNIQTCRLPDKSAELHLLMLYESYFPKEYHPSENQPHVNRRNGINMGKGEDVGEGYHER
jgi:hypothetical protein